MCHIARIFRAVAGDCRLAAPTDFWRDISAAGNWTCLDSRSRIDERKLLLVYNYVHTVSLERFSLSVESIFAITLVLH